MFAIISAHIRAKNKILFSPLPADLASIDVRCSDIACNRMFALSLFNRQQKMAEREKRSMEQQRKKMEKEAQRMMKKEQKIAVKLS